MQKLAHSGLSIRIFPVTWLSASALKRN